MRKEQDSRSAARAHRLEQEARNCIAIAIDQKGGFTADLIDEALRLSGRARELKNAARGPCNDTLAGARTPDTDLRDARAA